MIADQSPRVSRVSVVEALTQIRDLCDESRSIVRTAEVRVVLDAVSVDATPAHDRCCHAEVADEEYGLQPCDKRVVGLHVLDPGEGGPWPACEEHIDARYLGDGRWERATPAQGIDRDALDSLLDHEGDLYDVDLGPLAPKILALVRPVEGIVLSREEARRVVGWLDMSNLVPEGDDLALVNRLEAS